MEIGIILVHFDNESEHSEMAPPTELANGPTTQLNCITLETCLSEAA